MGATAAGGLVQGLGAKQAGEAQAGMYTYQAGIAQQNARIARQNEDYILGAGEQEAMQFGLKSAARMGQIKAAQGASGLNVGFGSAVDVRESQKEVSDIDVGTIRSNAARRAYGSYVESKQDEAQAGLYTMSASQAKRAGDIGMLGSFIGAAGSVSSKWLQAQQMGVWS